MGWVSCRHQSYTSYRSYFKFDQLSMERFWCNTDCKNDPENCNIFRYALLNTVLFRWHKFFFCFLRFTSTLTFSENFYGNGCHQSIWRIFKYWFQYNIIVQMNVALIIIAQRMGNSSWCLKWNQSCLADYVSWSIFILFGILPSSFFPHSHTFFKVSFERFTIWTVLKTTEVTELWRHRWFVGQASLIIMVTSKIVWSRLLDLATGMILKSLWIWLYLTLANIL